MNWFVIIPFGVFIIVLILFLVKRNRKDAKEFEQQLNDDYRKPKDEEGDIEIDEVLK